MKDIKGLIAFLILVLLIYVIYDKKKTENQEKAATDNQPRIEVKKRFDEKGRLEADAETLNGVHHGIAHNYYSDGTVHSEIHYLNGMKQGNSTWYYQSGKKYRVTPYLNNNRNGIQQKFYENGILMAEIPFKNDTLQPGTKEFTANGKPIIDYPDYSIRAEQYAQNHNLILFIISGNKIKQLRQLTVFNGTTTYHVKKPNHINANEAHYLVEVDKSYTTLDFVCWIAFKTDLNNLKITEQITSL
ncbi:MAG: toxin-antitoxin system YwqK family antitoxin [Salinivirgaceae bacterium]